MTPSRWLQRFAAALERGDINAAANLFEPQGYWRDLVAFTWNIRTCEGRAEIKAMLAATLGATQPMAFALRGSAPAAEAWFSFETALGRGIGHLRLRKGRCWTLLTTLQELKGYEEQRDAPRAAAPAPEPYCLIVGGGQGGIALAARLKRLSVPAVVVEKNARAGDSWRRRYASLCLHDPVWYDHLPYLPFPEHWPVFSPKDRIADWLEMYVKVMELDYRAESECISAVFEESAQHWRVTVRKNGEEENFFPKHLVLATGMSGFPNTPTIPGAESFAGTRLHSSRHAGGAGWAGKRCVVVGSGTSAHDICADLVENGAAEVTMIQRAPTIVVTSEALLEHAWGPLYSERAVAAGISTAIADLTVAATPFRLLPAFQRGIYQRIKEENLALYAGLDKAGFLYDFGEDGSGIHSLYLRRGAGYYIEVGASQMIIDGRIRLRSGVSVKGIRAHTVLLSDDSELSADLIVYATGYGSMNQWAAKLISQDVADRVGKCWGLGSATKDDPGPWVGELRNMWKPTQVPALWFHGGNLMQSRHYSLYLALQLKARYEGLPTPVYFIDPVHHRQ